MFSTAYNVLGTTGDKKRDFVSTFSSQTTEIDRKLGSIFAATDLEFGTAFITLIRLALSHAQDNSAILHKQLDEIINTLPPQVATNVSSSPTSLPPSPLVPIIELSINNPNPVIPRSPRPITPKMEIPNKDQKSPTPPKFLNTPKRVNIADNTRPIKKINKSVNPTNNIRPTPPINCESRDHMEIDSTDVTHHISQKQQPTNYTPVDLLDNPWMEIDNPINSPVIHLDNVAHIQPVTQPCLTNIDTFESESHITISSNSLTTQGETNVEKSSPILLTVDDSIHSPPKSINKNKNSQTYDARVPVSDIPGSFPSEKSNFLHGWFRGITALKRIYIDEIFNMDYFVLQFDNVHTMRKLVRNFNEHSDSNAKMVPIVYVRQTKDSLHHRPHDRRRGQDTQMFKIIDLDGSDEHIELAKKTLLTIAHEDVVQFTHEQPSPKELHFWINSASYANKLSDRWSIIIGSSVFRLGPAKLSRHQFKNRNKYVGRSETAAKFTDAQLLTNLESNGAKDVYRRQSEDGSVDVFVVFDSDISYRNAVTKSVWMFNTNLGFVPQTHISTAKQLNNRHARRSPSPRSSYSAPINNDNTYAVLDSDNVWEASAATATNCIPLGRKARVSQNTQPTSDRPDRS